MNAGVHTLASRGITAPLTAEKQTAIVDLDGMTAATIVARFAYGSGGTTCVVVVRTSFDGGTTWYDIARFDFTTASATKIANLSGLLSKAVAAYSALASENVLDGVLGNRLQAEITTTGTYADTTLDVRAAVR